MPDLLPLAGVELGGTKCVAVLGRAGRIVERVTVPTAAPVETLGALADTLAGWRAAHGVSALGIGSFGPVRIDRAAADYGRMLATPKPGWAGADIAGLAAGFDRHLLHTDVTAAALAEGASGAAQGLADHVYVTVGTGVGMGVVTGGRPLGGALHPEAGHLRVRRTAGDAFAGTCPFHGDCLEGLVSGPALAARFGGSAADAAAGDPRWAPVADALAEAFALLFLTLSPARIVVGGGVGLGQAHLLPAVRAGVAARLGGYLGDFGARALEAAIVPAALGADAGPLGTLVLAGMA